MNGYAVGGLSGGFFLEISVLLVFASAGVKRAILSKWRGQAFIVGQ